MACHTVQVTAARDLLEQQLKETQATLASSAGDQAPAAVAASPFAQCSGVPLELQRLFAELKTENARLSAEAAELHSTAASNGGPSGRALLGMIADMDKAHISLLWPAVSSEQRGSHSEPETVDTNQLWPGVIRGYPGGVLWLLFLVQLGY